VQRFRKAVEPLGEARADWEILARVAQRVGLDPRPARAEDLFRELARTVPAFSGLSYRSLGDLGQKVQGPPHPAPTGSPHLFSSPQWGEAG